jgi:hypothetical protein
MRITRFLPAIGLAVLVILTTFPSQGQAPKSGGWLTLRLREDLDANKPLKIEVLTRRLPAFVDLSSFVIGEFRRLGIDASLRQVDTPQWGPLQTRGEFEVGVERRTGRP